MNSLYWLGINSGKVLSSYARTPSFNLAPVCFFIPALCDCTPAQPRQSQHPQPSPLSPCNTLWLETCRLHLHRLPPYNITLASLISSSNQPSKCGRLWHYRVHRGILALISNVGGSQRATRYSRFLSFSSRPRMKSALSPRAPRGLWAWSAITAALALKAWKCELMSENARMGGIHH